MSSIKKLSDLSINENAIVHSLENGGALRRRLTSLGVIPGAGVKLLFTSICGDPSAYLVQNTVIAIRKSDADSIMVI